MKILERRLTVTCLAIGLFSLTQARAATINATNCSSAAVTTAINSAASGDMVAVPAGTCTWSSNIKISNKAITVEGAGPGNTVITSGAFTLADSGSRITGFTFNIGTSGGFLVTGASHGFRIDHNTVTRSSYGLWLEAYGIGANRPKGLVDNNDITKGRLLFYGESTSTGGRYAWASPLGMGTDDAIYYEHNTITYPGENGNHNSSDCNHGGRLVIRFNDIIGGRLEVHSLQADNRRACMLWEYYNNTLTNTDDPNYRPFFIRGGTGVVFHNTTDGKFVHNDIDIDNVRSWQSKVYSHMSWGKCDGTSWLDGNAASGIGYLCRDQIGAGPDASLWDYSQPAPAQAKVPAYFWMNKRTDTGAELKVNLQCPGGSAEDCADQSKQIVRNRDYFVYNASFDGASGVGEGTLANRPVTCTTGVGYWATDQGEWNSEHAGNDGQLYKCTAPNTWTVYYIPYTYPHPLQNGGAETLMEYGGANTLGAPAELKVISP